MRSVCLSHYATGGATSAQWYFVVWYPPGHPFVEPLIWEPRSGTPLLCSVNDRVQARPYAGTRQSGVVAGEQVLRKDGYVLDSGLFPASEPNAMVLLEAS